MLIGYARVSSADQRLEQQIDALNAAGCERVYSEKISGVKTERPELGKMLAFAREGDTIVVWKLDRLGRSVRHLCEIVEDLKAQGIGFRSLTEDINTETPMGRAVFHIIAALAQMEREGIKERVNAGIARARAEGVTGGRPKAMNTEDVQKAKRLLAEPEATLEGVAETMGVSTATLRRYGVRRSAAPSNGT